MQDNFSGGTITYYFNADTSDLESGLRSVNNSVDNASSSTRNFESSASRSFANAANAALDFAQRVTDALGSVADTLQGMMSSVESTFEKISGIDLPTADMGYVTNALSIGNEMAAKMEGASMGMTLMTKDANATQDVMDKVVQDATRTTFNVSNLLGYTQQIGAAAHGDFQTAERAALGFGGAMVAAGNGLRDMGLVVRNIQQGMARGYNSIDLRQFKTYIPQFSMIMEQAGLTDEKIIEMGVDGAKAVNEAIANWVEAEGIWEKYEHTYTNLKESLNEALQTTALSAMQNSGLFDALKNAIEVMKDNLPILEGGLTKVGSTIAKIVNSIDWKSYMKGVAAGIEVLATWIENVYKIVTKVLTWLGGGDLSKGIERAIPGIVRFVAAIKLLGGGIGIITKFGNAIFSVRTIFSSFGKTVDTVAGKGGKGGSVGGKIPALTQLAISIAAFAAAIWLINKAIPDSGVGLLLVKLAIVAGAMVSFELISKLAAKLNVNEKDIGRLTLVAGEIAAFAAALWIVNTLIPDDMGALAAKLGVLAIVIAAFGGLAVIAGIKPIAEKIQDGLVTLIAIAGTLAGAAIALRVAYEAMPSDFEGFQVKIGSLALVITEIGVFAGVLGAIVMAGPVMTFLIAGLASLVTIAGSLTLAGAALRAAYEILPSDLEGFQQKIGAMTAVVGEIGVFAAALGASQILSFGTQLVGLATLVAISESLASAAINLNIAVSAMPANLNSVKDRIYEGIEFLMQIKEKYAGEGGLFASIGSFFFNNDNLTPFETIVEISRKLAQVAVNLNNVAIFMPSDAELKETDKAISRAVVFLMNLRERYCGRGGLLPTIGSFFFNNEGTQQFDTINEIAKKLEQLAESLANLNNISTTKLARVVNGPLFPTLKLAIDTIVQQFSNDESGFLVGLRKFIYDPNTTANLDKAGEIVEKLQTFVDNLSKIEEVQPGKILVAIDAVFPILKQAVDKIYSEFTGPDNILARIGSFFGVDSSELLNKATEISETLAKFVENISKIQDLDTAKLRILAGEDAEKNPIIILKDVVNKIKSTFVDDADSVTNKLKEYDLGGLEVAKNVVDNITQISEKLSSIGDKPLNMPAITQFFKDIKQVVDEVSKNFGPDAGLQALSTETTDAIASIKEVVTNLTDIASSVNQIPDLDTNAILTRITAIRAVIERVMAVFTTGYTAKNAEGNDEAYGALDTSAFSDDEKSYSVGQILSTINSMKQIADAAVSIPDIDSNAVVTKINSIREIVKAIIWGFDNAGEDALDMTSVSLISENIQNYVPGIINTLKDIASTVGEFPDSGEGAERLKTFVTSLTQTLQNLSQEFTNAGVLENLKDFGTKLSDSIFEGFKTQYESQVGNEMSSFAQKLDSESANQTETLKGLGKKVGEWIVEGIKDGLNNGYNSVWDAVRGCVDNATNGDQQWVAGQRGQNLGWSMANGIINALNQAYWSVWNAANGLASAVKDGISVTLSIHSPSRVMYQYGQYTGQGFVNGIQNSTGDVAAASWNLGRAAVVGVSYESFKEIGASAAQGLADGLSSLTEQVASSAKGLADAINSEMNIVNPLDYVAGSGGQGGGVNNTTNKTNTINMTNNIYNELDMSAMMSSLKWEMAKG